MKQSKGVQHKAWSTWEILLQYKERGTSNASCTQILGMGFRGCAFVLCIFNQKTPFLERTIDQFHFNWPEKYIAHTLYTYASSLSHSGALLVKPSPHYCLVKRGCMEGKVCLTLQSVTAVGIEPQVCCHQL